MTTPFHKIVDEAEEIPGKFKAWFLKAQQKAILIGEIKMLQEIDKGVQSMIQAKFEELKRLEEPETN